MARWEGTTSHNSFSFLDLGLGLDMRTKYKPPNFFSECLRKLSCANLSNLASSKSLYL